MSLITVPPVSPVVLLGALGLLLLADSGEPKPVPDGSERTNPTCPFCGAQVPDPDKHAQHVKECEKKVRAGQDSMFGQQRLLENPSAGDSTYWRGDKARYTGKMAHGLYELELLEGQRAGQKVYAASPEQQAERAKAQERFQQEQSAFRRLRELGGNPAQPYILTNPEFFTDQSGVIHPVRGSSDYEQQSLVPLGEAPGELFHPSQQLARLEQAVSRSQDAVDRRTEELRAINTHFDLRKDAHEQAQVQVPTPEPRALNAYEQKIEDKRLRLEAAAKSRLQSAEKTLEEAHRMADVIPFGQPILVGHHSEKRDRAYRGRIDSKYRQAFNDYDAAQTLEHRAAVIGKSGISSDDPDAVGKLQRELEKLEATQAEFKAINAAHAAYVKDPQTLERTNFSEKRKELIRNYKPAYSWEPHPIAPFQLTNNSANIRRIKARIADLSKPKGQEVSRSGDGWEIHEDPEDNRLAITFDKIPDQSTRTKLKSAGFRWSPTRGAWVRQLNNGARFAAERVLGPVDNPAAVNPDVRPEDIAEAKSQLRAGRLIIGDRYKDINADKEIKGYRPDSGDPVVGYAYSPEAFVPSDATGRPIRFYVTLANGAQVHPDEISGSSITPEGSLILREGPREKVIRRGGGFQDREPSFERAVSHAAFGRYRGEAFPDSENTLITLEGPNGTAVTQTRRAWRQLWQRDAGSSLKGTTLEQWAEEHGYSRNPDAFTDDRGIVHPIRASRDYDDLATEAGQHRAGAEDRQFLRELFASGYTRTPLQVQRRRAEFERDVDRAFKKDAPITREPWMRSWSRENLVGLAEYSDIPLADMSSDKWLRELDPEKVFEYRDHYLSKKRSYGLPPANARGGLVHARRARARRRERQVAERKARKAA